MKAKTKHISTECYPCIFQQFLSIATLAKLNDAQKKIFFETLMQYLLETHGDGIVVQHIIRKATDTVIDMLNQPGDFDLYKAIKAHSNDIALNYYQVFKEKIKMSGSPLKIAVKLAAAGNIIDFGAKNHANLDIEKELDSIDQSGFGIYHFDEFAKQLSTASTLLYICDNSGEIVLDKVFIEEIKIAFPSLNIICAVRDRPIINDAVLNDALYVGLDQVVSVISSGSIYPGTILEETSHEFKKLFDNADLIISKGQGNFETLLDTNSEKMFFILKIKCDLMARLSNTQQGNLVLMQGKHHCKE
ncbi:MAG: ARMT1-like domain-containing protein [Pseudomonadota bacterium]